jgi:hypothetical protein
MTHETDPRITAYVFGELSAEDREQFETELQASPALRRLVDETRQTLDLLSGELRSELPLQLTDRQRELLSREIAATPAAAPAKRGEDARRRAWQLAAAAAVLAASLLVMGSWGIAWFLGGQDRHVAVGDVPTAASQAVTDISASPEPATTPTSASDPWSMVAGPAPRDPTAAQGEREHAMPASGYGMYGSSSGDHPPPPGLVASSGGGRPATGPATGLTVTGYDGDIGYGGGGLGGMGDVAPGMASAGSGRRAE